MDSEKSGLEQRGIKIPAELLGCLMNARAGGEDESLYWSLPPRAMVKGSQSANVLTDCHLQRHGQ